MPATNPESTSDIAAVIKLAISNQKKISLRRSRKDSASTIHLQLNNLAQIVDYPFDDMTVTVQAGITCAELSRVLAEHNQQLPIDVQSADTTIGQLVAANLFGPRVCGYGTIRDYLIGIQAIDGAGRVFRAGGKVVKNVAGYDLCRLLIGSHGRLAVITECTFKLNPIPASTSAMRLHFDSQPELTAALHALNSSNARPTFIDIHAASKDKAYAKLTVGVEGSTSSCHWQLEQIQQECKPSAIETVSAEQVSDYLSNPDHFWPVHRLRIKVRRSQVATVADQLIQHQQTIHGYAADGILHCSKDDQLSSSLQERIPTAEILFCNKTPPLTDQQHPLNKRLLNTFDPHGIFVEDCES